MKNFWLSRLFHPGKRVQYKGFDKELVGKVGQIVSIHGNWIDVQFAFPNIAQLKIISVEKDNLEII